MHTDPAEPSVHAPAMRGWRRWASEITVLGLQPSPELLAIAIVYFVQGSVDLATLASAYFMKDDLKVQPAQAAMLLGLGDVPWMIKPIYGFISDTLPLCGYKRKSYLVASGVIGAASWALLAVASHSAWSAAAFMTAASAATAFSDVVVDAIVVERSQSAPTAVAGSLQSLCWTSNYVGQIASAYFSGHLVQVYGNRIVFALTAVLPLLVSMTALLIKEQPSRHRTRKPPHPSTSTRPSALNGNNDNSVSDDSTGNNLNPTLQDHNFHTDMGQRHSGQDEPSDSTPLLANGQPPEPTQRAVPPNPRGTEITFSSPLQHTQTAFHHRNHHHQLYPDLLHPANHPPLHHGADSDGSPTEGMTGRPGEDEPLLRRLGAQVRNLWKALRQRHILLPTIFVFVWQSTPTTSTAMFYFYTNHLGFTAEFQGWVALAGAVAGLSGVLLYNACLKNVPLKRMMLWCMLLGALLGSTQLVLVSGLNRKLGLSDALFVLGDNVMIQALINITFMPVLVLAAQLCPEGVEATLYATLMSVVNGAGTVGAVLGAGLTSLFGVTKDNFDHMLALVAVCNLLALLPLPFLTLLPDQLVGGADAEGGDAKGRSARDTEMVEHTQETQGLLAGGWDGQEEDGNGGRGSKCEQPGLLYCSDD